MILEQINNFGKKTSIERNVVNSQRFSSEIFSQVLTTIFFPLQNFSLIQSFPIFLQNSGLCQMFFQKTFNIFMMVREFEKVEPQKCVIWSEFFFSLKWWKQWEKKFSKIFPKRIWNKILTNIFNFSFWMISQENGHVRQISWIDMWKKPIKSDKICALGSPAQGLESSRFSTSPPEFRIFSILTLWFSKKNSYNFLYLSLQKKNRQILLLEKKNSTESPEWNFFN